MRVKQLLETNLDFSPLEKILQGDLLTDLLVSLEKIEDDEAALLHQIITNARSSHASPERVVSFIKPLLAQAVHMPAADYWGRGSGFAEQVKALVQAVTEALLKLDPKPLKQLKIIHDIPGVKSQLSPRTWVKLKLAVAELTRTPPEKKFDTENDVFVFIGRKAFREDPPGSDNYKKTLEIENLIMMDKFAADEHNMVGMMQLRARHQGDGSEVFKIVLPKGVIKERSTFGRELPQYLIDLIDKHKEKVT